MQVLLDFLRRYNYLFLFLILEIFSILMLVRFNRYQGYVWLTGANEVAASVNGAYTGAVAFTELREVNRSLTDANIRLKQETMPCARLLPTRSTTRPIPTAGCSMNFRVTASFLHGW